MNGNLARISRFAGWGRILQQPWSAAVFVLAIVVVALVVAVAVVDEW